MASAVADYSRREAAVDWVVIAVSGVILLALAVWTVLREDRSTARRGRHRGRAPLVRPVPASASTPAPPRPAAGA
jgi:hypothetical protein